MTDKVHYNKIRHYQKKKNSIIVQPQLHQRKQDKQDL